MSRETKLLLGRRTLVAGAVLAGLAARLWPQRRSAEEMLLAAFSDGAAAAQLGRAESWPVRNEPALAELVLQDIGLDAAAARRLGRRALRQRLAQRIAADFAAGRTFRCDGWLISVTEARLCALAAGRG